MECNHVECCFLDAGVADVWFSKSSEIECCNYLDGALPMWDDANQVTRDGLTVEQGKLVRRFWFEFGKMGAEEEGR